MKTATEPQWRLQPAQAAPLHVQLEQRIKEQIAQGHWKAGEQIPSERALMQLAGVSRATVRQTINSLAQHGILERQHGRGTFVTRPSYEQPLHPVYSFSEHMQQLGLRLDDHILRQEALAAPEDVARLLQVPVDTPLVHLQRLRLLAGVPLMINSSFVSQAHCPALLTETIPASLYRLLTEKYGFALRRSVDVLEAISADAVMANHLQIARGVPLMYVIRVAYTDQDVPLHVGYSYIRGDMCRFRIDLRSQIELIPHDLA